MATARPALPIEPRRFGRRAAVMAQASSAVDDVRLFALTFAGGFLFTAIFIV